MCLTKLDVYDVMRGDRYFFEFALHEDPTIYEYVTFGEYDAETIQIASLATGYYGDVYRYLYYKANR